MLWSYTVMLAEIVEQLDGEINPCLFVQRSGWSNFSCLRLLLGSLWGADRPLCNCRTRTSQLFTEECSSEINPIVVTGDLETLMAGLACGEVSSLVDDSTKRR
ncbi:hypothetical protein O9929_13450 [Vibrio lentus]|nr:hypothetical protein [Vibrio lentus]